MSGSDLDLDSPPKQFEPTRAIVFDKEASPIRDPTSPTKGKGKGRRIALGELTPGAIARRTRSTASQPPVLVPRENNRPARPRLSPDKVGRHFTINFDGGNEWAARDVRFVIWYYCRTMLQFDSIATAYNSTYPEADLAMTCAEAEAIVETIKSNWAQIRQDLEPGHFATPEEWGWHPCDHLMTCTYNQAGNRQTVMRNLKTRVAGVKLIKEILTTMWHGSWEELLQCPRTHGILREAGLEQLNPELHHSDNKNSSVPPMASQLHHPGDRSFSVQPIAREDQISEQISLADDTDRSGFDDEHVAEDHRFRRIVRRMGGPKVLYHFVNVTLGSIFLLSMLADWFRPVRKYNEPLRIEALTLRPFVFMTYGGLVLLGDIRKFMKFEVLMFQGVEEPPPLSIFQKILWSILGIVAALIFSAWRGWFSSIEFFLMWSR
jgi:hypothetical protein